MVTEADRHNWSRAALLTYADAALDASGPERGTFGADWPVCLRLGEEDGQGRTGEPLGAVR